MNHKLLLTLALAPTYSMANTQPDIIYILADDLGYGDVGFNGSDIKTPNIDKIAQQGVQLQNYYVCPVSSPTRAGLITGRYPINFGMMRGVVKPQHEYGVDTQEEMLPEMLAKAGYESRAAFGKWHLGHLNSQWHPHNRGFTEYIGCLNGAVDYFDRVRDGQPDWHHNGETLTEKGYTTDLIGNHAVEFIKKAPADKPFFAYVAFTAPHAPLRAKDEDIAKYPNRKGKKQIYAAMVDCMDQNIGKILEAVEKRGNLDNTLIIFSSDNGGKIGACDNGDMRGGKALTYEGGIRVAACAMWQKGDIKGGGVIRERIGYIDIFPTLRAIAYEGRQIPADKKPLNGENVLDYMRGNKRPENRMWYSYIDLDKNAKMERLGVNYGDWKLVVTRPAPDNKKVPLPKTTCELFKLNEKNQEKITVNNKEIEDIMLNGLNDFMSLKLPNQIKRGNDVASSFKAPLNWYVK